MRHTENEITGAVARRLREEAGLTQTAFWEPLGVKQSVGCRYEAEVPIPQAVRILLVARYVVGIQIDATTPEGLAELGRLADIQANDAQARATARAVRSDLTKAAKSLQTAANALESI